METEWYRKNLGTKYEGSRMPWLYHHYVGHDNNRDWFMLTQKETQALSRSVYHDWLPQVWLDEHQMGSTGPRIFVPPYSEPVSTEIHPLVWRDVNLIGANMALAPRAGEQVGRDLRVRLRRLLAGGTKNTAWWKNISGLLTEMASVRFATPIRVDPSELSGGGKGSSSTDPRPTSPTRGQEATGACATSWTTSASSPTRSSRAAPSGARTSSATRWCGRAPPSRRSGQGGLPDSGRPARPGDRSTPRCAAGRARRGAQVRGERRRLRPARAALRPLLREMLSVQRYPEVKLVPGKEIVRPYDLAAWTLPLMMGVTVDRATLPEGLTPWKAAAPRALIPAQPSAGTGSPENAKLVNAALHGGGAVRIGRAQISAGGSQWPAERCSWTPLRPRRRRPRVFLA